MERESQLTYASYGQSLHTCQQTQGTHYNNIADSLSKLHTCSKALHEPPPKLSDTVLDTTILPEMSYPLAECTHIPSGHRGHRGVTALIDLSYCHCASLTMTIGPISEYPSLLPKKTLEGSGRHVISWGNRPYSQWQSDFFRAAATLC